jgi:hypothetical protein
MTIYEIDEAIRNCIDEETGEVDFDAFAALQEKREEKISGAVHLSIEAQADIERLNNEIKRLKGIIDAKKKTVEGIGGYLAYALAGEKYDGPDFMVRFRTSEVVEIDEDAEIPEEYIRIKMSEEPDKAKLKQAIKNGKTFEGVSIKSKINTQIK